MSEIKKEKDFCLILSVTISKIAVYLMKLVKICSKLNAGYQTDWENINFWLIKIELLDNWCRNLKKVVNIQHSDVELSVVIVLVVNISIIYHHHHVVPLARISLTLSRHFSLSFIASGRSSRLHPVSSHSCCMYCRAGHPAFSRPYVGVHWSTSLMSSPLLL